MTLLLSHPVCHHVTLCRRKTLLWLDDAPHSQENKRIRDGIPGYCKKLDAAALKAAGIDCVSLKFAGFDAAALKTAGFDAAALRSAGFDDAALKSAGFENSVLRSAGSAGSKQPEKQKMGAEETGAAGAGKEHASAMSLHLDLSRTISNDGIPLEDQVDVHLFTSVDKIVEFLRQPNQHKLTQYPPSLFRIVTNRRLFVGDDGFCAKLSGIPNWQSAFPAIMVFHGGCDDGLDALKGRPNLCVTQSSEECAAFVSFQTAVSGAVKASDDVDSAPIQVMVFCQCSWGC